MMVLFTFADYLLKTEIKMDKQIELSLSVDYYTSKPKNIAQIRYKRRTLTQNSLMVVLKTGYCIAHCFKTKNEIFTQSEKTNDNFEYTQMIGVDIDDCDKDMETFIKGLKRKPTFAYTTFSNGIKGNRFRMIYLFNQKIGSIPLYKAVYNWITEGLNINDNCMRSVSQQMFGTNFAAKWYNSNVWYDVPTEYKQYNNDCKTKVLKSTTQKQLPKTSQKWQSEYNKKKEEHYIGNANLQKENGHLLSDNTVVKVLYSMSPQDFIFYFRNTFDYFTATPLHYENGYALLPDDYYEVKRPWYKDKMGDNTISVVKTIRDGEQRRKRLCNTAIILRAIKRDISFEHLLYILVCERTYYYDNQDKVLSNKELISIAKWAIELPSEQINPQKVKHSKFKVDKSYWAEKGITARQAANIVRGIIKETEIGELYDCSLTDKANLAIMKEYGIKVSQRSLTNFKRKYIINYPKSVKNEVSKASGQNFAKSSNPNIIIERETLYPNCQFITENDHLISEECKNKNHNKARKMKQDIIKDYYNPQLTDEQNVKLMNDNGLSISIKTLRRWRKSNGIQREIGGDHCSQEYKSKKQLPISEATTQNQSIKVQNIADKSKCNFQSANSSENQSEKIKVQLLTNQSAISDQSEKIKVKTK